jgi:DNA-binding FadR family transcriptional regulator
VEAISALPARGDIDADYSPQYVKLARIIRAKIKSGGYKAGDPIPADALMAEYQVSKPTAQAALQMLAANNHVTCPAYFQPYRVTGEADHDQTQAGE